MADYLLIHDKDGAAVARGLMIAARMVGTRAHMSEEMDADPAVAFALRLLEEQIQRRAHSMLEASGTREPAPTK